MNGGVLFDLDGVLVATETLKARAHAKTIQRLGGQLDPAYYSQVMGKSHYLAAKEFSQAAGISFEHERYSGMFEHEYGLQLDQGVELIPGAEQLVVVLRERGYRLAVVSSSLRWMMDKVLSHTELDQHFDACISGDDVEKEKPAPEPYLKALEQLSLEPAQAVVIEDTESGIASATAAGVRAIAVKHEFNGRHDLSGAIAVLEDLSDTKAIVELIQSSA